MRHKLLVGFLLFSLALNIVGAVIFVQFVNVSHRLRSAKRERTQIENNIAGVRAWNTASNEVNSGQIARVTFNSLLDGVEDTYAYMPPAAGGRLDNILMVYLHGMGSNYMEPFCFPAAESVAQGITRRYPDVCLLSPSYRKEASWCSAQAFSDITQNIRALLQQYPFKRIIIAGSSMGGCTALSYACKCPSDIRSKLAGVVSSEGSGDLCRLADSTTARTVKAAIIAALGGTEQQVPAAYKSKSFLPNLSAIDKRLRFAIISAKADVIVPPSLQNEVVGALQRNGNPVKLISVEGGHGVAPSSAFNDGIAFVLEQ